MKAPVYYSALVNACALWYAHAKSDMGGALNAVANALVRTVSAPELPQVVVIVGTSKVSHLEAADLVTDKIGAIVLMAFGEHTEENRVLHRRRIALADAVYVVNPDGYVGDDSLDELRYAKALGKPIVWAEPDKALAEFLPPEPVAQLPVAETTELPVPEKSTDAPETVVTGQAEYAPLDLPKAETKEG